MHSVPGREGAGTSQDYFETRFPYKAEKAAVWQAIVDYLDSVSPWPDTVLDAGAGWCYAANALATHADAVHAVDVASRPLEAASDSVATHQAAIQDLPYDAGSMGAVVVSNVFEHLDRDEIGDALAEARRVLCSGGKLVVITPDIAQVGGRFWDDHTHVTPTTFRSMRDWIARAGFDPVHTEHRFLPFSAEGRLPETYHLTRALLNGYSLGVTVRSVRRRIPSHSIEF